MRLDAKLRAVIRHEFLTIVKQPSFWIALVAFPLIAGIVLLIGALTDSSDKKPLEDGDKSRTVIMIDSSNLISQDIAAQYKVTERSAADQSSLIESVKRGQTDGLIIYPSDLASTGTYQLYADNTDQDNAALMSELGRTILQQSLLIPLESQELSGLALTGGTGNVQSYKDGEPARQTIEYIVPGAFLVLFYVILIFSVGYALTSISEEKENRSIEMVLSYVQPQKLIVGKLIAIIMVTLTQIVFITIMAAIAYLVARSLGNDLSLPFKISDLTFVPAEIVIGASFLVFGFIFFVGLMATLGAIFPSTKEASGFSSVFFLLPAVPFWGIDAILGQPESTFTQILSYFPLTSPTTILLRNAAGNISPVESLVSLVILVVSTALVVALAAKAFRLGTLEYNDRIRLSQLFRR